MRISIGTLLLHETGDGSALSDFAGDVARAVQVTEIMRAESVSHHHRGNRSGSLKFTICRQHASEDAVIAFLCDHEASIPEAGPVRIVGRATGGAEVTRYFDGRFQSGTFRHHGNRSWFTYTFIGGRISLNAPTS